MPEPNARMGRGGLLQAPSWRGLRRVLPMGLGLSLAVLYAVVLGRAAGWGSLETVQGQTDYPAFLTGARLVADGQAARLYDPAAQEPVQRLIVGDALFDSRGVLPYNHLPFLAVALVPLAGLPILTGWLLWTAILAAATAAALAILSGELLAYSGRERAGRADRVWAVLGLWGLALGFFPLFSSLLVAQVTPLVLLGLAGAVRAFRGGHEATAGLWLTLGLLKPQIILVPLLVLLLMGRWATLRAFALVAGLGLAAATVLLGGPGWIVAYARLLGNVAGADGAGAIQPLLMANLRGQLALWAFLYDPTHPGGGAAPWVLPLALALAVPILAGLAWAWRRGGWAPGAGTPAARAWDLRWAATLVVALLTSPHLPVYELALWLVPGVLVWRGLRAVAAGDPAAAPPVQSRSWLRLGLLVVGWLAGVLALPLARFSPLQVAVLAALVGLPLLLGLATQVGRAPLRRISYMSITRGEEP